MVGNIDYKNGQILGKIDSNNDRGIFGVLEEDMNLYDESQALPAASQEEVREGNALVRCCIDGEIHDYTIEIMDLDLADDKDNRNMVIKITDPNLLNRTNGIIQGMGVIDNMDNTKKPVNAGFSAVTLKENQTSVPDQHRHIRTDDPL